MIKILLSIFVREAVNDGESHPVVHKTIKALIALVRSPLTYVVSFAAIISATVALLITFGISAPATHTSNTSSSTTPKAKTAFLYVGVTSSGKVVTNQSATTSAISGTLDKTAIGIAPDHTGGGYWVLHTTGAVTTLGNAPSLCGGTVTLSKPVSIASTPQGEGFWVVSASGQVVACGSAPNLSTLPAKGVTVTNITEIVSYSPGDGYWLVGSNGGIFAFGKSWWWGVPTQTDLNGHGVVVGLTPTSDAQGYWIVTKTGAIFAFGNAQTMGMAPAGTKDVVSLLNPQGSTTSTSMWLVEANGTFVRLNGKGTEKPLSLGGDAQLTGIVAVAPLAT